MLKLITVKNFKCFKDSTQIEVGPINLLTGVNERGKSTALQTLLLMHQSLEHSRTTDQLVFNGKCLELGNFDDVRNTDTPRTEAITMLFRFQGDSDYIDVRYYFGENETDEMSAQIQSARLSGQINGEKTTLEAKYTENGHVILTDEGQLPAYWQNLLFTNILIKKGARISD